MKWTLIYRLITDSLTLFLSGSQPINRRFTFNELPTWIKQSKDLMLRSTVSLIMRTRGQRPNESQKAVIIDMMKSVGEIASKIWPVVYYLIHFWENFTLTFDLDQRSRSSALGSLNALYWVVPWYQE